MPQTPHTERHFTAGEAVRDVVIGMSDGLTVPFALAAGLSGAVATTHIVVTAGLAEIAAGSIAMGLGGYLAARSDAEHYAGERERELREVAEVPEVEKAEVAGVFRSYGLTEEQAAPIVEALSRRPEAWVDFMMRCELGLEEPSPGRALTSAVTIAGSYVAGGLIPLAPYMMLGSARAPLDASVLITLAALLIFGYIKGVSRGPGPSAAPSRPPSSAGWRRQRPSGSPGPSPEPQLRPGSLGPGGPGERHWGDFGIRKPALVDRRVRLHGRRNSAQGLPFFARLSSSSTGSLASAERT